MRGDSNEKPMQDRPILIPDWPPEMYTLIQAIVEESERRTGVDPIDHKGCRTAAGCAMMMEQARRKLT